MKRFHIHIGVSSLEKNTQFYSALFGIPPTVKKNDSAKWMLDDPRMNFAISERGGEPGVNHPGIQTENAEELEEIHTRLQLAETAIIAEGGAKCCYAKSDKYWVQDPSGIAWESFHSLDAIPFFGESDNADSTTAENPPSCCPTTPAVQQKSTVKSTATSCCNG